MRTHTNNGPIGDYVTERASLVHERTLSAASLASYRAHVLAHPRDKHGRLRLAAARLKLEQAAGDLVSR